MAFLHFLVLFKNDSPWSELIKELADSYGLTDKTLRGWKVTVQLALQRYIKVKDLNVVGGEDVRVAIDETVFSKNKGISKGPQKPKAPTRLSMRKPMKAVKFIKRGQGIRLKRPGQTIWTSAKKKQVAKYKGKMAMKAMRQGLASRKQDDARSSSRWLWVGVELGRKSDAPNTHAAGNKRVAICVLDGPTKAPQGKPRGQAALEIVFEEHSWEGSYLLFDGWPASEAAADAMGLKHGKPVNHSKHWRDPDTGLRINDAESGNSRVKKWTRKKYSYVRASTNDGTPSNAGDIDARDKEHVEQLVAEYLFWVNKGRRMQDLADAFVVDNGAAFAPVKLNQGP